MRFAHANAVGSRALCLARNCAGVYIAQIYSMACTYRVKLQNKFVPVASGVKVGDSRTRASARVHTGQQAKSRVRRRTERRTHTTQPGVRAARPVVEGSCVFVGVRA